MLEKMIFISGFPDSEFRRSIKYVIIGTVRCEWFKSFVQIAGNLKTMFTLSFSPEAQPLFLPSYPFAFFEFQTLFSSALR